MAARPTDTKESILRLGMEFIQTYGYHSFSYADIAKELKIKNAAVHYHFPGKEDLLAEIVEQYIQRYHELARSLEKPGISSRQKIQAFINRYTLPEKAKVKLTELVKLVLGLVEKVLREGKKKGELTFSESARVKSILIMTNLAAGVQLARITGQQDYTAICNSLMKQLTG